MTPMMTTLKLAAMTKISNEHVKPLTSQAKSCSPTDMNVGEGDRVKPGSTWIKFPTHSAGKADSGHVDDNNNEKFHYETKNEDNHMKHR